MQVPQEAMRQIDLPKRTYYDNWIPPGYAIKFSKDIFYPSVRSTTTPILPFKSLEMIGSRTAILGVDVFILPKRSRNFGRLAEFQDQRYKYQLVGAPEMLISQP